MNQFQYNLAKMFPWWPSTKIVQAIVIRQKNGHQGAGLIFPIYLNRKPLDGFQFNLAGIFFWWPFIKSVHAVMIRQKISFAMFLL